MTVRRFFFATTRNLSSVCLSVRSVNFGRSDGKGITTFKKISVSTLTAR
nr:MAG TPA: hypothetical protein [Caudoviricetes sp.]